MDIHDPFETERKLVFQDLTNILNTGLNRHQPHYSYQMLWRWARRGVCAHNGERVRLEHERRGGRLYTSVEAIQRFGQNLAEADTEYFDESAG